MTKKFIFYNSVFDKHFMLSNIEKDAMEHAKSEKDKKLFAFNVRNLLTQWGPSGAINDYAGRIGLTFQISFTCAFFVFYICVNSSLLTKYSKKFSIPPFLSKIGTFFFKKSKLVIIFL